MVNGNYVNAEFIRYKYAIVPSPFLTHVCISPPHLSSIVSPLPPPPRTFIEQTISALFSIFSFISWKCRSFSSSSAPIMFSGRHLSQSPPGKVMKGKKCVERLGVQSTGIAGGRKGGGGCRGIKQKSDWNRNEIDSG